MDASRDTTPIRSDLRRSGKVLWALVGGIFEGACTGIGAAWMTTHLLVPWISR